MSMSRRSFISTSGAAVAAAGTLAKTASGANDRIGVCCIGIRGRGSEHIKQFSQSEDSEVVALCDVDARVLESRGKALEKQTGKKPKLYRDVRDALADEAVDAISIATPNHWHSLMTIWGCQAGKDVYVEKPLSHNIYEGRQLVAAAKKYGRIVQHGTQSRSSAKWMRDIKLLQDGFIGKMHLAKGFTYKTGNRRPIGFGKPAPPPPHLDWTLWQGPATEQPYLEKEDGSGLVVHYNWHWFWNYGNAETGNQGVHQMDLAVWGMNKGFPVSVYSSGGRYKWKDQGETPNTQMTTFTYADGTIMEFEVRNVGSYQEAGQTTGNHYLCADGYYVEGKGFFDYSGKSIKVDAANPETRGPWLNFLDSVRSRDEDSIHGNALDGHMAAAHCHLANAAFRAGRSLEFDSKTERFVNDDEANAMLTRTYRDGFEVPKLA